MCAVPRIHLGEEFGYLCIVYVFGFVVVIILE